LLFLIGWFNGEVEYFNIMGGLLNSSIIALILFLWGLFNFYLTKKCDGDCVIAITDEV